MGFDTESTSEPHQSSGQPSPEPAENSLQTAVSPAIGANPIEAPSLQFQHVAPQNVKIEQRTSYIFSLVVGLITLAVTVPMLLFFAWSHWWVAPAIVLGWILLGSLLFWGSHVWPVVEHRHTWWRLSETGLEIHRGVLWKHQIAVPVARVQHVDVSQGPVQRMFQLGTLTVHTAGTQNASVGLAGLEHSQALQLRDQLIEQKESLDVT